MGGHQTGKEMVEVLIFCILFAYEITASIQRCVSVHKGGSTLNHWSIVSGSRSCPGKNGICGLWSQVLSGAKGGELIPLSWSWLGACEIEGVPQSGLSTPLPLHLARTRTGIPHFHFTRTRTWLPPPPHLPSMGS